MLGKFSGNEDVVKLECEALLQSADDNSDGRIDRAEFKQLLRNIPYNAVQQSFELFVRGKSAANDGSA